MLGDERDTKVPRSLIERPEFIAACAAHNMNAVFALAKKYAGLSTSAIARMTAMKTDNVRAVLNSGRLIEDFAVNERIADGLGIPGAMLGLASRPWEQVAHPPIDLDTGGTSSAGIIGPSGTTS